MQLTNLCGRTVSHFIGNPWDFNQEINHSYLSPYVALHHRRQSPLISNLNLNSRPHLHLARLLSRRSQWRIRIVMARLGSTSSIQCLFWRVEGHPKPWKKHIYRVKLHLACGCRMTMTLGYVGKWFMTSVLLDQAEITRPVSQVYQQYQSRKRESRRKLAKRESLQTLALHFERTKALAAPRESILQSLRRISTTM